MTYVFDRTIEDVMRAIELRGKVTSGGIAALTAEEQAEYNAGLKGAYNYQDLNRVEANTYALSERLRAAGYAVQTTLPALWTRSNIPTKSSLERIRKNIEVIRGALKLRSNAPSTPNSLDPMDVSKANNIERIQYEVDLAINAITSMLVNLGTFYMGEGGFLI